MSKGLEALHTIAFNTQFIAGINFGNELRTIEKELITLNHLLKIVLIPSEKESITTNDLKNFLIKAYEELFGKDEDYKIFKEVIDNE